MQLVTNLYVNTCDQQLLLVFLLKQSMCKLWGHVWSAMYIIA